MESVISPCKSIPSIYVPEREEFSTKALKPTISFKNAHHSLSTKPNPRITDQVSHLCRNGRLGEAINLVDSIVRRGSKVRRKTFTLLFEACIDANELHLGRKLHQLVESVKNEDPFVGTKLVSLYAISGCLKDAREVFDRMRERNLYTWTSIIGAYSREKRWKEVVELFYLMMEEGVVPDGFLVTRILQACGNCRDVETGELIHSVVVRCGMDGETYVGNSVLAVYAKCGKLSSAFRFFEKMEMRDSVSWNTVITGYCQNGEIEEAFRLFKLMHELGIERGLVTWNVLISTYVQSGRCDIAMKMVKEMETFGITPDVFTWTSIISGFSQNNKSNEALDLFREMLLAGVEPNEVTLMIALSACASLKALKMGRELHLLAVKLGFTGDILVGNSLIDMYSKCSKLKEARLVFYMILKKDAYTWNSMIGGYFQAGHCGQAHNLFIKMRESGVKPNVITWNAMLTGYMENGDFDLATDLFQRMEKDGGVKRDTASWNALIAGYLQNGQKDQALGIFRQMQSFFLRPNSVTILSVLPACSNLVTAKKVKEIHCCVLRRNLASELSVANCLIDSYAKSGNIIYSEGIFSGMSAKDIISWNTMISGYVLHGRCFDALDLFDQMKIEGFEPNSSTFACLIYACSMAKMFNKGKRAFLTMTEEYSIVPHLDHFVAMIDLYGHSGRFEEALKFIDDMPIEPNFSVWATFFTACRFHGNTALAVHTVERLIELEPGNTLVWYLAIQAYAICGISEDCLSVKNPGKGDKTCEFLRWSMIEIGNSVYSFVAGDQSQPVTKILYPWIKHIAGKIEATDSCASLHIEEEVSEKIVGIHSEKIAIAFALINSSKPIQSIRILKNLRMCRDCHTMAKYVSKAYKRDIYIKDTKRLHHFKDGNCSCRDY